MCVELYKWNIRQFITAIMVSMSNLREEQCIKQLSTCVICGLDLLHFLHRKANIKSMLGQKMLLVQMSLKIYSKLIKNQNLFVTLGCGVGN